MRKLKATFVASLGAGLLFVLSVVPASASSEAAPEVPTAHRVTAPAPIPGTPEYHFTDKNGAADRAAVPLNAVDLPFHFTFNVKYQLDSREFKPVNGKACVNAQVDGGRGEKMTITMFASRWWGWENMGEVNYPTDGKYNGYCWSPLSTDKAFFKIIHVSGGPAVVGFGDAVPN
jgi:hypothetical protein